jgi:hypothetical protein
MAVFEFADNLKGLGVVVVETDGSVSQAASLEPGFG